MEEIRSWWEVPSIAHFCSLFRAAFDLSDFDIEELEDGLLASTSPEDSSLVLDLICRLLEGCYGRDDITFYNYGLYLKDIFKLHWEIELQKQNPLEEKEFTELPLREKVDILHALCDFRLDCDDVADLLKGLDGDNLRVEPMGYDETGAIYWYFYGTRLYKEVPEKKPEVEQPKKNDVRGKKKKPKKKKKIKTVEKKGKMETPVRRSKRLGNKEEFEVEDEENKDSDIEDDDKPLASLVQPLSPSAPGWYLVCSTLEDWQNLAEYLKDSKVKCAKNLYKTIIDDFLPEIPIILEEKEKELKKKLLDMAPKRSSGRLEVKRKQMEEEAEFLAMQMAEEEKLRLIEEGERKKRYEEERLEAQKRQREERERLRERQREEREKAREERAKRVKMREERAQLIAEGKEIPPELINVDEYLSCQTKDRAENVDEDLFSGMRIVLNAVKSHVDAWPFWEPVKEEFAPNYFEIVQNPIDLSTIEDKVVKGIYTSRQEFIDDFKLMFDNCEEYNGENSDFTYMSRNLEKVFNNRVKRYLPEEEHDDEEYIFEENSPDDKQRRPKRRARTAARNSIRATSWDDSNSSRSQSPIPYREADVNNPRVTVVYPALKVRGQSADDFKTAGGNRSKFLQAVMANKRHELQNQIEAAKDGSLKSTSCQTKSNIPVPLTVIQRKGLGATRKYSPYPVPNGNLNLPGSPQKIMPAVYNGHLYKPKTPEQDPELSALPLHKRIQEREAMKAQQRDLANKFSQPGGAAILRRRTSQGASPPVPPLSPNQGEPKKRIVQISLKDFQKLQAENKTFMVVQSSQGERQIIQLKGAGAKSPPVIGPKSLLSPVRLKQAHLGANEPKITHLLNSSSDSNQTVVRTQSVNGNLDASSSENKSGSLINGLDFSTGLFGSPPKESYSTGQHRKKRRYECDFFEDPDEEDTNLPEKLSRPTVSVSPTQDQEALYEKKREDSYLPENFSRPKVSVSPTEEQEKFYTKEAENLSSPDKISVIPTLCPSQLQGDVDHKDKVELDLPQRLSQSTVSQAQPQVDLFSKRKDSNLPEQMSKPKVSVSPTGLNEEFYPREEEDPYLHEKLYRTSVNVSRGHTDLSKEKKDSNEKKTNSVCEIKLTETSDSSRTEDSVKLNSGTKANISSELNNANVPKISGCSLFAPVVNNRQIGAYSDLKSKFPPVTENVFHSNDAKTVLHNSKESGSVDQKLLPADIVRPKFSVPVSPSKTNLAASGRRFGSPSRTIGQTSPNNSSNSSPPKLDRNIFSAFASAQPASGSESVLRDGAATQRLHSFPSLPQGFAASLSNQLKQFVKSPSKIIHHSSSQNDSSRNSEDAS